MGHPTPVLVQGLRLLRGLCLRVVLIFLLGGIRGETGIPELPGTIIISTPGNSALTSLPRRLVYVVFRSLSLSLAGLSPPLGSSPML